MTFCAVVLVRQMKASSWFGRIRNDHEKSLAVKRHYVTQRMGGKYRLMGFRMRKEPKRYVQNWNVLAEKLAEKRTIGACGDLRIGFNRITVIRHICLLRLKTRRKKHCLIGLFEPS